MPPKMNAREVIRIGRKLLDQVHAPGRREAETVARGEVMSMLIEGMAVRSVSNPGSDCLEIGRVVRAVMAFLLSDQPLQDAR